MFGWTVGLLCVNSVVYGLRLFQFSILIGDSVVGFALVVAISGCCLLVV